MKITTDNYEIYALDFLDGNLRQEEENAFLQFLDQNPAICDEIQGTNQMVLLPDSAILYPKKENLYHKDKAIVIPLWNVSRIAAAAAVLLLVSVASIMIWKSSKMTGILPANNELTNNFTPVKQPNLPATSTPMPAEQPETSVMADQGIVKGLEDNASPDSPAVASGSNLKTAHSSQEKQISDWNAEFDGNITESGIAGIDPEIHNSDPEIEETIEQVEQNTAVAFLPIEPKLITYEHTFQGTSLVEMPSTTTTTTYEIHIPGQFLSETWADVSLANFKKKLLPEFISTHLNL